MVTIKLIFKVIDTFGLMDKDDQETYLHEASKEWSETPISDAEGKEIDYTGWKAILVKLKKLEKNWLFSVGVAIASIFIIRQVGEYMQPPSPIDEFRQGIH